MRLKWILAAVLSASLVFGACAADSEDDASGGGSEENGGGGDNGGSGGGGGDADAGQEKFNATCATCHGTDGENPSVGKNLRESDWIAAASDDDLIATITNGRPTSDPENTTGVDMPAKGGNPSLNDEDIANIAAYIRSINGG